MSRSSDLNDAARQLAAQLYSAEEAAETALAEIGALMAALPVARRTANLAASTSHGIYIRLLNGSTAFVGGLGNLVEVHGELARLKENSIARSVAIGTTDKPDEGTDRPGVVRQARHLRALS